MKQFRLDGRAALAISVAAWTGPLCMAAESPPLDTALTWIESPAGQPVIDRGPDGAWDHYAADNPFVLIDGKTFYCFYEGQDKPFPEGGHEQIGLAVSRDGVHWEKSPHNPILRVGPAGAWDNLAAKIPVAIRHAGQFHLFYSGRDGRAKQIGFATSRDLIHWTKHPGNPVLRSRPGEWDALLSTMPAPVYQLDGRYYLLFRGMKSFYREQGLGVAVSDDLVHWRRFQNEPVMSPAEEISSLAVAQTADGFLGITQRISRAADRSYWLSKDLIHWQKGPAARFTGPAVDTLSNPFLSGGRWTVLYEQGDRIYRAVLGQ